MGFKSTIVLILALSILSSCEIEKQKLIGKYTASISRNNIDSLILNNDNTYIHTIYSKDGNTIINKNEGKWTFLSGNLELEDFYHNDNRKFKNGYDYSSEKGNMYVISPVNSSFGEITIDINSDLGNVYVKVD